MKLFHSPTWPYKSIINVHIHPVHFCISCTHFLRGVCVGWMKGTHEGIYTVGWGLVFLALSGIAITSFSPGTLPKKSLLHCRFIQCRLFFFFLVQCHTHLVETSEMWRKNCIHLHGIHLSIKKMKCIPFWLKNRASKERCTKHCMETLCDELYCNWARNTDFYLWPQVKYIFLQSDFHENHTISRILYREIIYRVWSKLGKKRRK